MIVGSKLDDVLAVSIPTKQDLIDETVSSVSKEPLSQQKVHRKVLDKGIPEDVMPGILDSKVATSIKYTGQILNMLQKLKNSLDDYKEKFICTFVMNSLVLETQGVQKLYFFEDGFNYLLEIYYMLILIEF